jgi:hypothetical protein
VSTEKVRVDAQVTRHHLRFSLFDLLDSILPLPDQIPKIGTRLGPATPEAASAAIIVLRRH